MKFELIIKNAINNSPIEKESQSELLIFENERISCPYLELSTKKKKKKFFVLISNFKKKKKKKQTPLDPQN